MDADDATGRWRDVPLDLRERARAALVCDILAPGKSKAADPTREECRRLEALAQLFGGLPVDRVPVATERARIDVRWEDDVPVVTFEDHAFTLDDRGRVLEYADGRRITWDRGREIP